jgi:GDSL-like Lipase/Acylhydrolase family
MPKRRIWPRWSRKPLVVQGKFAFSVRAENQARAFKRVIAAFTGLVILAIIAGTESGRYASVMLAHSGRSLFNRIIGLPQDRELEQERINLQRLRNAASARSALANATTPGSAMDRFLRAAGMDAGSAVMRWGNVNRSILLSSAVFEPDDKRSYRLKPGVRAVWVIGLSFRDSLAMFLIPDAPPARDLATLAGGVVVPESVQTTNSWGCRGPEPDPAAPVRVLVLGDSMMQGSLVGDTDTPPAKLECYLSRALKARVSVLNTGHLGYSPEQYEQTLRELGERFHPHYVIVSIYHNDFGDMTDPANWAEGEYWLDRIMELCMQRGWQSVFVPAAEEAALLGPRNYEPFQSQLNRIIKISSAKYVDTIVPFTDALLRLRNDASRSGGTVRNPLYNLHLMGDGHYSPLGADLWARAVARRVLLLWDQLALSGMPSPEPVMIHAHSPEPAIPAVEAFVEARATTGAAPNPKRESPK